MRDQAKTLSLGRPVTFKPRGKSMEPLIKDGQEVTVRPRRGEKLEIGDVVLCCVQGKYYLHKILDVNYNIDYYLIGNNKGRINGWTNKIFGVVEKI